MISSERILSTLQCFSLKIELRRLLGNIRVSGDISNSAVLSKVWDNPLAGHEESEAQFQADLRAASGVGKKGKGKGKVCLENALKPTPIVH